MPLSPLGASVQIFAASPGFPPESPKGADLVRSKQADARAL